MILKHKPVKQVTTSKERAVSLATEDLVAMTAQTEDKPSDVQPPAEMLAPVVGNTTDTHTQQRGEDLSAWLKETTWPQPKWLTEKPNATKLADQNFNDYVKNSLRWRYLSLENEFRTALNNFYGTKYVDRVIARRIIGFLETSRQALEHEACDALSLTNMLNMAEQYMVYLYPPHVAEAQASALAKELTQKKHPLAGLLPPELIADPKTNLDKLRAALDKIKDSLNQENQRQQVDDRLQLERLEMLVKRGKWILGLMVLVVPILFKNAVATEGVQQQGVMATVAQPVIGIFNDTVLVKIIPHTVQSWVIMLAIALIGAVGAFLSGLMQMRDATITMSEFTKSIVQFRLRPIVGAIFAIIITTLLSWNLITGVQITTAGTYILAAFLCGFSERYFLDLLDIKGKETVAAAAKQAGIDVSSSVAVSTAAAVPAKEIF
jgi:hypothetical protein